MGRAVLVEEGGDCWRVQCRNRVEREGVVVWSGNLQKQMLQDGMAWSNWDLMHT